MRLVRFTALAIIAVMTAAASGCGSSSSSPSSAAPSGSTAPSGSAAPSVVCTPDAGLAEVRALVKDETTQTHYLTISDLLTISIWAVDQGVNPEASQAEVAGYYKHAYDFGLGIAYRVAKLPCAPKVFEQVNPMIVDSRNQNWYIGFISTEVLAGLSDPSPDDLEAAMTMRGIMPARQRKRAPVEPASASRSGGTCTWASARDAMLSRLESSRPNITAYQIIGGGLPQQNPFTMGPLTDVDVETQWVVESPAEARDAVIRPKLDTVVEPLFCLSPAVNTLEVFVVDRGGQLIAYVQVDGAAIRSGHIPLPAGAVTIQYMHPQAAGPTGT